MHGYNWVKKYSFVLDILFLIGCFVFLITYFRPQLLFLKTITAGGDTGSHYYSALYMRDVLLPHGKVMGWLNANYAGFPIFYHYFPLPFILMAALGSIIPLEISFKIVTVLGIFMLPLSVYLMLRLMDYKRPVPISGAVITLAYLFNEKNSMWGGNIPSTLAGEFSFSISLSLFVILLGAFYKGIKYNKYIVINSILIALMGLSHGYTLVLFTSLSTFYLLSKKVIKNFSYILKIHILGFMFMAFWFIPFIVNSPWVTPYRLKWIFQSKWELVPMVLIPFFGMGVLGFIFNYRDRRNWFLAYSVGVSILGYFLAYRLGLADIRFLTFAQFFLSISAPTVFLAIEKYERSALAAAVLVCFATIFWVAHNTTYIKHWIKWNYSGFEGKATWPQAKDIFNFLRETGPGRVAYENSPLYDRYGTMRVFESLRLFAGRDTLEGLYMQSSITAPFVFFIQSEVSKSPSGPFPDYQISPINLEMGKRHLELFSVTQLIVISDEIKRKIRTEPDFQLERAFGDIEIWRIKTSRPQLVVPAEYEPVAYTKKTWKREFYEWFREPSSINIPLVRVDDESDLRRFWYTTEDIKKIPLKRLNLGAYKIKETIGEESIEFDTNLVGHPHIIRISYHPNWKVEGADKIYHVAPTFMLVYPTQGHVKLHFVKSLYNTVGEILTLVGISIITLRLLKRSKLDKRFSRSR